MGIVSSHNARSTFPLMQLSNELLAGVAQRCKEKTRRRLECVDRHAAAVTRAHGYIRRQWLAVDLCVHRDEPFFSICGQLVQLHAAPAAVRSVLARRRRVTRLRLGVEDEFDNDWLESTRDPSVAVLDILLGSDRLKLTVVFIDERFGRGCGNVVAAVACLALRHADTIVDMNLWPCTDDYGIAAEHEHAELCQAVAACVDVQHLHVRVGDRRCLKTVDCLPSFSRLRILNFCATLRYLDFDALPRPSQLERLTLVGGRVADGLTDMLLQRPDVCASLRHLDVLHFGADLPDGLLDAAPRLHTFAVRSGYFVLLLGGCNPLSYARALVGQFFAANGERRLCFKLSLVFKDEDEQGGEAVSFESVCVELLSTLHAAAPDVAIACSDARVFVLGCGDILKAAVEANPAMAAVVGRRFVNFLQSTGADAAAYAAVVAAAGGLLQAEAAVGGLTTPDYAVAAPFFTDLVAATGGRVQLATELADEGDTGGVVYQLTRGDGAGKRQLDILVSLRRFAQT